MNVLFLNGPNLNLLGSREPDIYGRKSLQDISDECEQRAAELEIRVAFRQSNHEGELVEWIHEAIDQADAIVINAGAYTHTSIALHDALKAFAGYIVELHISNPHLREPFRQLSYISPVANAVVLGLGADAYVDVLETLSLVI